MTLALVAAAWIATGCDGGASAGVAHDALGAEGTSDGGAVSAAASVASGPTIVFLGDSLAAGYGLGLEFAFPTRIQERLAAEGRPGRVVNAGVSFDTTEGGRSRMDWVFGQHVDVLVVALGGNDGLRGIGPAEMEANLRGIVARARQQQPAPVIILAGMLALPNMGSEYAEAYRDVFPRVAEDLDLRLIPFLLEGVGGDPELNQGDGIHPNEAGHRRVADNVWAQLLPVLEALPEA